jgi:hypothetical protein
LRTRRVMTAVIVIARSEATKQPTARQAERWIASLRSQWTFGEQRAHH